MTRTRLQRRTVTDQEFREALANKDNENIINKVLSRYYKVIPAEDLKTCGTDALWRCLAYHQPNRGNKFTTSLWRFTLWECQRVLKKLRRQQANHVVNMSTIETKEKFEIPVHPYSDDIVHMHECIGLLNIDDKQLIQEYYFDRRTMEEIGQRHGYSKETASQKINKAVQELRKLCLNGVS